jgi:hypothetical protein
MKLSDLRNKTRKTEISFDGESMEIEYRAHAMTVDFMEALTGMSGLDSVTSQVERVVARWGLVDDEGKEIPATKEAIHAASIPIDFLTAVLHAVTEDLERVNDEKNA